MKLNEIIELNGKEYTVELNRDSIVKIEEYVNTQKTLEKINKVEYEDKSEKEISKDENPFANTKTDEELIEMAKEKEEALIKLYCRAFWIWLYPVEKLSYDEVKELIIPYLKDEEKAEYLVEKYELFSEKSIEIKEKHNQELKNLIAQAK